MGCGFQLAMLDCQRVFSIILVIFQKLQMSFQSVGRIPELRARMEAKERRSDRSGGPFRVPISQRRKLVVKRKHGWECGRSCPSHMSDIAKTNWDTVHQMKLDLDQTLNKRNGWFKQRIRCAPTLSRKRIPRTYKKQWILFSANMGPGQEAWNVFFLTKFSLFLAEIWSWEW